MAGTLTDSHSQSAFVPTFGLGEPSRRDWRRLSALGGASAAVHVLLVLGTVALVDAPTSVYRAAEVRVEPRREPTRLIAPPSVLTQKAPNKGPITQEFDMASLPPRPAQANVPASPGAAAAPRRQFTLPDRKAPAPAPVIADAPQIDTPQTRAAAPPPPPALGRDQIPPPPTQIQPQEKPKIAFERPGVTMGTTGPVGLGRVPTPARTVDEAARQVARGGGRGLIVGDDDASSAVSPSSPAVPIPGKLGSAVELLSDPMGVDFWPYLVKVLSTVRRNWFAVIPESARMGRQGRTAVQFSINKDGGVPKLVIAGPSGTEALDRAAVAAVSASNPFPPLPPEFRGSQVRLQFVFKYNVR